jgi:hypothetical protein
MSAGSLFCTDSGPDHTLNREERSKNGNSIARGTGEYKNLFAIAPVENCARRDLDKVVDD